jgi:endonuclease/exonuclease/phosphatase family metal-dependent hydrolase
MTMLKADLKNDYDFVGIGRESANNTTTLSSGEACAIFYNKAKYTVVESNTFWLTDTPNVQSRHPDTEYIRIMTYAIFERKSDGYRFMHVNTHLDFANKVQMDQVSKMLELIDNVGFEGLTFVTGDFNMTPAASAYQLMLNAGFKNSFDISRIKSEPNITSMIDFCFVRDNSADVVVEAHYVANEAVDKVYNERFPSDHCAVYATVVPVISKEN